MMGQLPSPRWRLRTCPVGLGTRGDREDTETWAGRCIVTNASSFSMYFRRARVPFEAQVKVRTYIHVGVPCEVRDPGISDINC